MTTTTLKQLSKAELAKAIEDWYDSDKVVPTINSWLERGDAVVAFENHDLGHPDIGHVIFFSHGSDEAQLQGALPAPGKSCPVDLGRFGLMAYRYYPLGYYKGETL